MKQQRRSMFGRIISVGHLLLAGSVLLLPACIDPKVDPSAQPEPPGPVAPNPAMEALRVPALPATATRARYDFESKVELVGYELDPVQAKPGANIKVTWYWRASAPPQGDWFLFTHLLDQGGRQFANYDRPGSLRAAGSISSWQKGAIYADQQEFQLPADLNTPYVTIAVGVWSGLVRLDIIGGLADRKNRALVIRLPVSGLPKPPPPVSLETPPAIAK